MRFSVRTILILAPLLVTVFLLQSYFWVPTYQEQTRGNPDRLNQFITASIGDASIINPILSSDSASGAIQDLVFEGLLDRDQDLRFRGRLATSWDIYEEAFFYVNEGAEIPGTGRATAEDLVRLLEKAREDAIRTHSKLQTALENIREISFLPPQQFQVSRVQKGKDGSSDRAVKIEVRAPARIKLVLEVVDQDLFDSLSMLLGEKYFKTFPSEAFVSVGPGERPEPSAALLKVWASEILPPIEHNPIILFRLRPDVKFHDGHVFEAGDVKFTFEAIMDPKNLSPRISDYEPVKQV
ncbi:MAG: ABC transporter substrate-binding protein, partial [Deltaproteobacteria bacterium]